MRVRRLASWAVALSFSAFLFARAPSPGPPPSVAISPDSRDQEYIVINIRAYIDGRSRLNLDDETAWWYHIQDAAPGRHRCNGGAEIEPTIINGVEWFPEWPDAPNCENRSCHCSSDVFGGLVPSIPDVEPIDVFIEEIDCRQECSLLESPSQANGFRAVIEFNDYPTPDSVWYEINLVLIYVPCEGELANYCTSTANSSGHAASINLEGTLSISSNDAVLTASDCPPGVFGLFFYGQGMVQHSFGDGYLCISPFGGLTRLEPPAIVQPDGTSSRPIDYPSLPPNHEIAPGSTWSFQYFFRDLAAGGTGFNLSDGVRATFCP